MTPVAGADEAASTATTTPSKGMTTPSAAIFSRTGFLASMTIATALGGFLTLLIVADSDELPTFAWAIGTALLIGMGIEIARHRRFSTTISDLRSSAAALRSTKDAVILSDPDGRVTLLNAAAERL